ncbi:hypothetical protein ABKE32_000478 [Escherichia albertii]|uniref:hypothetical protein n=1 Tax=Escherichia albertii TaxID=208962 RepID=UPI0007432C05|nr:hypothetical protein [Escherichia albertii]
MKISGLKNHIDGNNEVACPRCASNQVFIRNVAMRAHENGATVVINLGCSVCDDNFQLDLSDGPNTSVRGHLEFNE